MFAASDLAAWYLRDRNECYDSTVTRILVSWGLRHFVEDGLRNIWRMLRLLQNLRLVTMFQ